MAKSLKRKFNYVSAIISEIFNYGDDDVEEEFIICALHENPKRKRVCVENYIPIVLNCYSLNDFKSHFRLKKTTVAAVLEAHGNEIYQLTSTGGRSSCPTKQLLVTLWMAANQEVYRSVADRFNLSISTTWEFFHRVVNVLVKNVKRYICWPTNYGRVSEEFQKRGNIPNVIGAIDGSHIPICAPKYMPNAYFNRNRYHSIILQAVCDANYKFIDCYAGCPGSIHDARVFKKSPLYLAIQNLIGQEYHMLGDSAYACTNFLITPFKDNGFLSAQQKKFNTLHSVTRVCIEQSFGLLKGRFRILKYVNVYKTEDIPKIIMACCILHNICISHEDVGDVDIDLDEDLGGSLEDEETSTIQTSKRERIFNLLFNK